MYTEVMLRPGSLAGQKIYPGDARRMVAKALGEYSSPQLFGADENGRHLGRRINHLPPITPIVFGGGAGFIRITGVGQPGKEILAREMGNIFTALSKHTVSPVAMEMKEGEHKYTRKGFRAYRIGNLALAKFGKVRGTKFIVLLDQYGKCSSDAERAEVLQAATPLIVEVIDKGLAGMADQLGIDLPSDLGITIFSGELGMCRIHDDRPGHIGVVRNLQFSMEGELVGPWSVGHLRGHGYGQVRREIER